MRSAFNILIFLAAIHFTYAQDSSLLLKDTNGKSRRVTRVSQWNEKRTEILHNMEQAMGNLPKHSRLASPRFTVIDTLVTNKYARYTIRMAATENEIVPAYLYVPSNLPDSQRNAAMLVLHGTGSGGKSLVDGASPLANRALAKELAERGYVVIAPDFPGMGELKAYDFKGDQYKSGTMKGVFNHIRCVDLLQSLSFVDAERIGVVGHSLGGHNAMFVGAFDKRLKVIVSSCGWTLFDYYNIGEEGSRKYGGRLGPWAQEVYMPLLRDKYHLDPKKIPFDFDEVIAALAPRAFFSNSPLDDSNFDVAGVRVGIDRARRVYELHHAFDNIQVAYPKAGHDFPTQTRLSAYQFIDRHLKHTPREHVLE